MFKFIILGALVILIASVLIPVLFRSGVSLSSLYKEYMEGFNDGEDQPKD